MTAEALRKVRCPACGGDAVFSPANRWRPFCSPRCAGVDLGDWSSESFRVPVRDANDDDDEKAPPERDGAATRQ